MECRYVRSENEDGAFIVIPDYEIEGKRGVLKARVGFNRNGEVRATIWYGLFDVSGQKVVERKFELSPVVVPQSGVFCDTAQIGM